MSCSSSSVAKRGVAVLQASAVSKCADITEYGTPPQVYNVCPLPRHHRSLNLICIKCVEYCELSRSLITVKVVFQPVVG